MHVKSVVAPSAPIGVEELINKTKDAGSETAEKLATGTCLKTEGQKKTAGGGERPFPPPSSMSDWLSNTCSNFEKRQKTDFMLRNKFHSSGSSFDQATKCALENFFEIILV
ncbi:hypothetical protein TNCV_3747291 [Trichonephila clavipes]|nr:hypothetical protein TNCV_3747291 [Trichonephila clavipes]